MICNRCGYEYPDSLEVCPICRFPKITRPQSTGPLPRRFCPKCGTPTEGYFCPNCGIRIPDIHSENSGSVSPQNSAPQAETPAPAPTLHPMTAAYQENLQKQPGHPKLSGWVKALIVFLIILEGFSLTGSALQIREIAKNPQAYLDSLISGEDTSETPAAEELPESTDEPAESNESAYPAGCSSEEYSKIKEGMTYAQISAIIGGDAQGENTSLETDEHTLAAMWIGENNASATLTIIFEDGIATSISLSGSL